MDILSWIIIGGLVGWVASMIISTDSKGTFGNIIIGVIGGFIGGFIFSALGGTGVTGFNMWSFIVSVAGAVILLWLVRLMGGKKEIV